MVILSSFLYNIREWCISIKFKFCEVTSMSDKDIVINDIDAGKSFNWGKTSKDYGVSIK